MPRACACRWNVICGCPTRRSCWWATAARRGARHSRWRRGRQGFHRGPQPDRVRALAKICGAEPLLREQAETRHFDALVHSTPLGMSPHLDECFFSNHIPADVVFDMVYNPLETLLLRRAREQGRTVIRGAEMFSNRPPGSSRSGPGTPRRAR